MWFQAPINYFETIYSILSSLYAFYMYMLCSLVWTCSHMCAGIYVEVRGQIWDPHLHFETGSVCLASWVLVKGTFLSLPSTLKEALRPQTHTISSRFVWILEIPAQILTQTMLWILFTKYSYSLSLRDELKLFNKEHTIKYLL